MTFFLIFLSQLFPKSLLGILRFIHILRLWKGELILNSYLYIMLYKELDKILEGTKHVSKNINVIYSNIKKQNKIVAKILFYCTGF